MTLATNEPFGTLVSRTLAWMSEQGTTGLIKTLVEDAIRAAHDRRCSMENWSFLLWPRTESITLVANQRVYPLHEAFQVPRTMILASTGQPIGELADGALAEYLPAHTATGSPQGFAYVGRTPFQAQPAVAATVIVTAVGGDAARTWMVEGTDANGNLQSSTGTGTATTAETYTTLTNFTKLEGPATPWTGTVTLTAGATTVLTLGAADYGRSFRQISLDRVPTATDTLYYSFYRTPRVLASDGTVPDIPPPFSHLLVLDALLALPGYTRATAPEIRAFERQRDELELAMSQIYTPGHTVGAAPVTPVYTPR